VLVAAVAPFLFSEFFVSVILTKALWLGVAAASLTFLSAYGGMVSLAQVGIYGISGMVFANLVLADGGNAAAWSPWLAALAALVVATAVGLGFGAIASRSEGIYFLMITLAFSVVVFYFFSQVTELSGFGGVNNLDLPDLVGNPVQDPLPLYYTTLVVSVSCSWRCATPLGRRSAWRCRGCATSRRGCARSGSTSRATGCSRSRWRRWWRRSPACCRSGTTAASRRARSTWRRPSTC
jgi:ABC-type branched-subunit amino acid transport system permease subunit